MRAFKIERPIAFILILNTSAHTIGASIAGSQFDELWGDQWIWLFSLVFTFAMLQFTEILTKGLGVRFNRKLASYIAGPLSAMVHVSPPLIKLLHWVNAPFNIVKSQIRPAFNHRGNSGLGLDGAAFKRNQACKNMSSGGRPGCRKLKSDRS